MVEISDAIPIQFFFQGEPTFNESLEAECMIEEFCYNQERDCAQPLLLRFTDTEGNDYELHLFEDGKLIDSLPFTKFPPLGIPLLSAGSQSGSGKDWNIDSAPDVTVGDGPGDDVSKIYRLAISGAKANVNYQFHYNIESVPSGSPGSLRIALYDSSMVLIDELVITPDAGTLEDDVTFFGEDEVPAFIGVSVFGATGFASFTINELSLSTLADTRYIHSLSFTPGDLCERRISFKIVIPEGQQSLTVPDLDEGLQTTNNPDSNAVDWTLGSTPSVILLGSGGLPPNAKTSEYYYLPFAFVEGNRYTISVTYTKVVNVSVSNPRVIRIAALDVSLNTLSSDTFSTPTSGELVINPDPRVQNFTFTAPAGAVFIGVQFTEGSNVNYEINDISVSLTSDETTIGRTDEVLFTSDNLCGKLVQYKSVKNFAGIPYDADSDYFNIFIPGVFFHGRNPTDQKSLGLSNSRVINTSSTLKKQKKFSIQDCPDYMHTKIQLILQHAVSGSLLIDGVEWTLEESYDQDDSSPDSYPFSRAEVYLTRKNYVKRNVI